MSSTVTRDPIEEKTRILRAFARGLPILGPPRRVSDMTVVAMARERGKSHMAGSGKKDSKLTRRQLVRRAAAGSVAGVVALDAPNAAASSGLPISGFMTARIEAIHSPRSARVALMGSSIVELELQDDAFLGQGVLGAVDDLSSFEVGEQVAIQGERNGQLFRASEVQSVYREVRGKIVEDRGRVLETSVGLLIFPEHVRTRGGIGQLVRGQSIHANVWVHPASGEVFVAGLTA